MNTDIRKILAHLILFFAVAVLRLIAHEAGHLISVMILGGKINLIAVMPGIRLYPTPGLQPWSGWGAVIDYSLNNGTPFRAGFIAFIGSFSTAILGYGAIAFLIIRKPLGLAQFAWLTAALLFVWDIIAYSIFPELGLRHWIIIGERIPEPLIGALYMGLSYKTYQTGLTLHALISNGLILCYLFRVRASLKTERRNHKDTKNTKNTKNLSALCALCVFVVLIFIYGSVSMHRPVHPHCPAISSDYFLLQTPPSTLHRYDFR